MVIEADAIKNRDVIYRSLERMEHLGSEANLSQYVQRVLHAGRPSPCWSQRVRARAEAAQDPLSHCVREYST